MGRRPRIEVTERALQAAAILDADPRYRKGIESPFGVASQGIQLKDRSRIARWFNSAIMADHVWRKKEIGYDEVRPEELLHPEQAGSFTLSPTGTIVRGERGQEVLLSIPKAVFDARQMAKTAKNLKEMRDYDKQKRDMVEATAARFGGEAGDYVSQHVGPVGGIRDSYERIEVTEGEE